MKTYIPISVKKQAVEKMLAVQHGKLNREEAEQMLRKDLRHSSKLREDLVADLTADYDKQMVEALKYFRLI